MLLFSTKFPSEIAAALGLATSTPLTEGSRKTQRALYIKDPKTKILMILNWFGDKMVIFVVPSSSRSTPVFRTCSRALQLTKRPLWSTIG